MSTRETRRLQGPAGTNLDDGEVTRSRPTVAPRSLMIRRKRYAYSLIRRARAPFPLYGTEEWISLPEDSAERIAAVVRAAECWAQDGDEIPTRLALEIDEGRRADRAAEDASYAERAAAHRRRWGHLAPVPDRDDLETRVAKARAPRPGDLRPGGEQHVG